MSRVEVTITLELYDDPRLDDGEIAIAIEEALESTPLITGVRRKVYRIAHAEVITIGKASS